MYFRLRLSCHVQNHLNQTQNLLFGLNKRAFQSRPCPGTNTTLGIVSRQPQGLFIETIVE